MFKGWRATDRETSPAANWSSSRCTQYDVGLSMTTDTPRLTFFMMALLRAFWMFVTSSLASPRIR